ncbi:hypothetical protein CMQ_6687 [Grosmannia clavigera kw1407]|uniref:Uncharacterized protein n=1 Tax=Grosmannia clavigera (strain kw1407 / UAMH 11150) TaxID=655863 RepID=F0X6T4_GROCL|nr:uncharacterized protein CMQ_6687 [Grosmannia clavigera kw1407]EFX06366.1 hypothetical protein CMQ_6687 [Grosmannia clavigera kw1407]
MRKKRANGSLSPLSIFLSSYYISVLSLAPSVSEGAIAVRVKSVLQSHSAKPNYTGESAFLVAERVGKQEACE